MHVGFLTNAFGKARTIEEIIEWAGKNGMKGMEIGNHHVNVEKMSGSYGKELRKRMDDVGVTPTALSWMCCMPQGAAHFAALDKKVREWTPVAHALGIDTISTFPGFAAEAEGKDKLATIRDMVPGALGPLAEFCSTEGIRLAFENWMATLLQKKEHFAALLQALPQKSIGLNFDPSHLVAQGIDPLSVLDMAKGRVFHTHAKDTILYGYPKDDPQWEFAVPGYGNVDWGRYIRGLRKAGYDGVLSIEHEDSVFSVEEGLNRGLKYLNVYCSK
jgi:sugar phosphate isomerase/epimerase